MSKSIKEWRFTFHYVQHTAQLLFKSRFSKVPCQVLPLNDLIQTQPGDERESIPWLSSFHIVDDKTRKIDTVHLFMTILWQELSDILATTTKNPISTTTITTHTDAYTRVTNLYECIDYVWTYLIQEFIGFSRAAKTHAADKKDKLNDCTGTM